MVAGEKEWDGRSSFRKSGESIQFQLQGGEYLGVLLVLL